MSEKRALQAEQPLMYGSYTDDPEDDSRLRRRVPEPGQTQESLKDRCAKSKLCSPGVQRFLLRLVGEDWMVLILLGVITGFFSWIMDFGIDFFLHGTRFLYEKAHGSIFLEYVAWVFVPVLLIIFTAAFTYFVGPQAAGSGIPEIKVIVKGVMMKDHLSLNTLLAKLVGLTCALGSGMPLGKESPFVHIGSVIAAQLTRFMAFLGGIKRSEALSNELIIAGSAVGIAACFGSPIGGVLYSIEVASSFFLVRNYWKGMFAATISAFTFRFLPVLSGRDETITPLFKTCYRLEYPYDLLELLAFCVLGILSGLAGAFFVYVNGVMVRFIRSPRRISKFLVKTRVLYPAIVTFVIATLTFPPGFGQFMAGELTQRQTLEALFDNHTWSKHLTSSEEHFDHHDHSVAWKHPQVSVFVTLTLSLVVKFFMSAVAISMPVPCGAFVPAFVIGAGLGRLVGEVTAVLLPEAVHANGTMYSMIPGSYAVAGAAAMSGAATHTISTSMIVYELTGQINFLFPIIICVIVANFVSQSLQPSLYDSLIRIRRLAYVPDLIWGHDEVTDIQVEDMMVKNVKYITLNSTYRDLHKLLLKDNLRTFPLVKSKESMLLLGSVERAQLQSLLSQQLSRRSRLLYLHECAQNEGKVADGSNGEEGGHKISTDEPSFSTTHSFYSKQQQKPVMERGSKDAQGALKKFFCPHSTVDMLEDEPDVEDTMTSKEIMEWEDRQLEEKVDFNNCKIDPAAVQIVEHTSLQKLHHIFNQLGLDLAFVTSVGKLIGVVSHRELRKAIDSVVKVQVPVTHPPMTSFRECRSMAHDTNGPDATELQRLLGSEENLEQPEESQAPEEGEVKE